MNDEPMAEPIEPSTLTSAPVVATSAGVATIATIDFSPGEMTWVERAGQEDQHQQGADIGAEDHGEHEAQGRLDDEPDGEDPPFGGASRPACRPAGRRGAPPDSMRSSPVEIWNWQAPAVARKTMMP